MPKQKVLSQQNTVRNPTEHLLDMDRLIGQAMRDLLATARESGGKSSISFFGFRVEVEYDPSDNFIEGQMLSLKSFFASEEEWEMAAQVRDIERRFKDKRRKESGDMDVSDITDLSDSSGSQTKYPPTGGTDES